MHQSAIELEVAPQWKEYELLDSGNSKRLERYGTFIISRPDPQAIWSPLLSQEEWNNAHAVYERVNGKEQWRKNKQFPERWEIQYKSLSFWARLTPFKHTGIFPEQSAQWEWMQEKIKSQKKVSKEEVHILNLFAYTGIASLACAQAGARVTHVDASKPAITWARENQELSGLSNRPIRWILDDAVKFTKRELKRGRKYDGIIMDPPVYGHGPSGERWDFNEHFPELLQICRQLLSDKPLFVIINAYAISSSSLMLQNVMYGVLGKRGVTQIGELAIQEKNNGRYLSTGIFGRWSK